MSSPNEGDPFLAWYAALEGRYMADLTFQEVRRAVEALSVAYVEKRGEHVDRALATAGKRAAFALFYAPLHFLTVRAVVRELGATIKIEILDLGCGTGVAGAAWSLESGRIPVVGIERHAWAGGEARWTYRRLHLKGRVERSDLTDTVLGREGSGIVAAFTLNELVPEKRETMRRLLLDAHGKGSSVLIVEPIARRAAPWWAEWSNAFREAGGRADEWRFPAHLPESLRLMDKAAKLDHRELTARSLWLPPG